MVNHSLGIFEAILDGLRGEDVNVVVTVGADRDPRQLGPHPGHVVVARYIPLDLLLGRCCVVVAHAGAGTLLATLAAGLPSLLIPIGTEQVANAVLAKGAGVADVVAAEDIWPEMVRDAVRRLLQYPAYRHRAQIIGAEIGAMPGPGRDASRSARDVPGSSNSLNLTTLRQSKATGATVAHGLTRRRRR